MNIYLRIFFILCALFFLAIIIRYLVLKKLNLKYALAWLFMAVGMLILSIFPQIVFFVGDLIGIETASNTIFVFAILFLVIIIMTLTAIVSHMNNRVYRLTQMQAILEKRVRELEAKNDDATDV